MKDTKGDPSRTHRDRQRVCAVCEGLRFRKATYSSPTLRVGLPAVTCAGCGNLELDDDRIFRIARILEAPHVITLLGAPLRTEVRRLLSCMREDDAQGPQLQEVGARRSS